MTPTFILSATLSAAVLLSAGCNTSRANAYPDRSVSTVRRVDDIKQNARDQKYAVDQEAERITTRLDFKERQVRENYKNQRQSHINASDVENTERDAQNRAIMIRAKHDKDTIDAEVVDTLKTTPPENAAEVMADAARRKSEIDSRTATKLAPITSDRERSKAKDSQRGIEIDRDESKELSTLEQERSQARNETREKKLQIDMWANEELTKVEQDSLPKN